MEDPNPIKFISEEDCEEHFLKNYYRNDDGRYVVRLPLKEDVLNSLGFPLGDSQHSALKTLHSMEKKFAKNHDFKEKYVNFMREYKALGHMSLAPKSLVEDNNYYVLPHHGVMQGTKKLRTVFNGSSKVNGISLNDMLHNGPSLLLDLVDIIMRWRRYKYVFVADIKKMFRQILVDPRDRHLQTVLWRDEIEKLISLFILNTLTYGLGPSPFLAIRSLQHLAIDFGHLFPLAITIILKESYCDDVASGTDTIEEAMSKQINLIGLCKLWYNL